MKLLFAVMIAVLVSSLPAAALKTASVESGSGILSYEHHFIRSGADAESNSVLLDIGISDKTGLGMERVRISDDAGSITLGTLFLKQELCKPKDKKSARFTAYGGLRFLQGRSTVFGNMHSDGALVGLAVQKPITDHFTGYAGASVSLLDDTLTETELAVSYRFQRNTIATAGYKTYTSNGETIGGVTLGIGAAF